MNPILKQTRLDIMQIEKFCKSHPVPSQFDLDLFIRTNSLDKYEKYANSLLEAIGEKNWLLYQVKLNKSRI